MINQGKHRSAGRGAIAMLLAASAMAAPADAQFPVQDMDPRSLGLGYSFALRGQDITEARVSGNEVVHLVNLGYSPLPYLSLQVGVGLNRFSVEPHLQTRFRGEYGFTPSFGLNLYSPYFAEALRGTMGATGQAINSEDDRGYRYAAFVTNPYLGLVVSPTVLVDVTAGARLHFVDGVMKAPRSSGREKPFANDNIGRGYLAVTLKTPFERAFLHLDFDFSPQFDSDWSDGPRESSVSLSMGAILGWKGKTQERPAEEKPTYFPAYPEMKDRQRKMAEEIE
jgi:hypothetical protein